jgi:hypothetical protein
MSHTKKKEGRTHWLFRPIPLLACLVHFLTGSAGFAQDQPAPLPGRVATLAFFLDSVDTVETQTILVSNILTYRRSPDGKELDIPAVAVSYGLNRRVQVDFSVPYFRSEYGPDFRLNGMGDRFLSAKIRVLDPDSHKIGLAFDPTLEILGKSSLAAGPQGPKKYNFAMPLILQKNFSYFSLYGETGYITRGALFACVGADGALVKRLGLAANILYSRSTKFSELSQEFGLLKSRVDAVVGIYYIVNPQLSLFTSGGRTISGIDQNGTQYIVNFGVNLNFKLQSLIMRDK